MKVRKWIVDSLLLSFFVLLTPRTLWHHCDENSHSHASELKKNTSNTLSFKTKCIACDYDIDFMEFTSINLCHFKQKPSEKLSKQLYSCFLDSDFSSFSHRGPPTIYNRI